MKKPSINLTDAYHNAQNYVTANEIDFGLFQTMSADKRNGVFIYHFWDKDSIKSYVLIYRPFAEVENIFSLYIQNK